MDFKSCQQKDYFAVGMGLGADRLEGSDVPLSVIEAGVAEELLDVTDIDVVLVHVGRWRYREIKAGGD